MQEKKYFLSFCIPTYNRPKQIARLIETLMPQITMDVEVVIRDDSSNNETEKAVKEIFTRENKLENLSYYKGDKLGIDLGTLFVVEAAKGEYVWTFGDDDELSGNALSEVIAILKSNPEISFAWADYFSDGKSSGVEIAASKFFADRNEVLIELKNRMTLLSTFIFKKEEVMGAMDLAKKRAGSFWSIITLILKALSGEGKFYYFKGPYILNHAEPHGEADFYVGVQVFGLNLFMIFKDFDNKFEKKAIRIFFKHHFGSVWRGILVNMANYPVSVIRSGIVFKLFRFYWSYPEFWLALPFFLMPRLLLVFFYRIYKIFFSHRRWIFGKNT